MLSSNNLCHSHESLDRRSFLFLSPNSDYFEKVDQNLEGLLVKQGFHTRQLPLNMALNVLSPAKLLKRVFDVDVETCGVCGGKVKIIAAIKKPEVIKKILDHISLPSVPPEVASARGPPIFYDEEFNHDSNLLSDNLLS